MYQASLWWARWSKPATQPGPAYKHGRSAAPGEAVDAAVDPMVRSSRAARSAAGPSAQGCAVAKPARQARLHSLFSAAALLPELAEAPRSSLVLARYNKTESFHFRCCHRKRRREGRMPAYARDRSACLCIQGSRCMNPLAAPHWSAL